MGCMSARRIELLILALGVTTAGCATEIPLPPGQAAPELDEYTIGFLVDNLMIAHGSSLDMTKALLRESGPGALAALRKLLIRREEPSDPFVADVIQALHSDEPILRRVALDQLLLRGDRTAPDLWEAVLTSESQKIVLLSVDLLGRLELPSNRPKAVFDVLSKGGFLPSYRQAPPADAVLRIVPLRVPEEVRRFARPKDAAMENLRSICEEELFIRVREGVPPAPDREPDHQGPADSP